MRDYIESGIPEKTIGQIRDYCYSLAKYSEDSSFELKHMKAVEGYSLDLAEARGLNPDIAVLIALLHDIGRIKNNIFGKGHAEEGAAEADIILNNFKIKENTRKTIVKAIFNHNKKKKIHGKYSELIKDADSMSRYSGIPDYIDDSHEYMRNKFARMGKCRITNKGNVDITGILIGKVRDLKSDIREIAKSSVTPKLVHEIRIKIRAIRSIIWYIKKNVKSNCRASMEILDDELRNMFKDYELPRKVHVFRKKLKSEFSSGSLMDYLKELRKEEYKKIWRIVRKKHKDCINDITDRVDFIAPSCEIRNLAKLPDNIRFSKAMKSADSREIASLHRLRILCKKVMYLEQMGIIEFSQKDFTDLLKRLHRNIGLMNDRVENIAMIDKIKKSNPRVFNEIQYEDVVDYLAADNDLSEKIEKDLFELHVRI